MTQRETVALDRYNTLIIRALGYVVPPLTNEESYELATLEVELGL